MEGNSPPCCWGAGLSAQRAQWAGLRVHVRVALHCPSGGVAEQQGSRGVSARASGFRRTSPVCPPPDGLLLQLHLCECVCLVRRALVWTRLRPHKLLRSFAHDHVLSLRLPLRLTVVQASGGEWCCSWAGPSPGDTLPAPAGGEESEPRQWRLQQRKQQPQRC